MAPAKKVSVALDLPSEQLIWLREKAQAHGLPDPDKALRIVLTYVRNEGVKINEDVGVGAQQLPRETQSLKIEDFQQAWLDSERERLALGTSSDVVMRLIGHAMAQVDEQTLFGTIRCKHPAGCNTCG